MTLCDFVQKTRDTLTEKSGYRDGMFLMGTYVLTVINSYGYGTPDATADYVIAFASAPDAASVDQIVNNFMKGN